MNADLLSGRRLRLSRRVSLESVESDGVVVYHPDRFSRLKLSKPLYELLLRFSEPMTVGEIAADDDRVIRCLATLVRKGYLVPEGEEALDSAPDPQRRLAAPRTTLFRCPRRQPGQRTDIAVLGVPFDLGTPTWPGARWAPDEIRTRSQDNEYRVTLQGKPLGWFDVQRKARILEGVTFSDWGDVSFQYGEAPDRIYRRIESIAAEIVDSGAFPLVLGGDHSVAFPVVSAVQRDREVRVLYLDAHTDWEHKIPESAHNHASTARQIASLPNMRRMIQVGHRGFTLHDKISAPLKGVEVLTLWDVRDHGTSIVLDALPDDRPVYISIDIDVLDPLHAPATSNVTPGGFTPDELKRLLHAIGVERDVVGLDLCGLNPERDTNFLSARVACQIILGALGACFA